MGNNFQVELGILSSYLAFAVIFRSLDFIFKDANLIYEIDWEANSKLPVESMIGWDVRYRKFSQNTMAMKRLDRDSFIQIYGVRKKNGLALRLDVFGIPMGERFDFRRLSLNLSDFAIEDE